VIIVIIVIIRSSEDRQIVCLRIISSKFKLSNGF